jgi:hypothetical protein
VRSNTGVRYALPMPKDDLEEEDRAQILSRRTKLVAAALAGLLVSCGDSSSSGPQACLSVDPVGGGTEGGGGAGAAGAGGTGGTPMPCLGLREGGGGAGAGGAGAAGGGGASGGAGGG